MTQYLILIAFWIVLAGCDSQNKQENPWQFVGCGAVRESNQTLVFTGSALDALASNDVLYVFSQDSICVGQSDPFAEKNFAVAIWGDDSQTQEKDGLAPGEAFTLVLNSPRFTTPVILVPKDVEGPVTFVSDGITTIKGLERE